MVIISQFAGHDEKRVAHGYEFSSAVMSLNMGDHFGTDVGAPVHFDERPGARSMGAARRPPPRHSVHFDERPGAKSIAELPLEDFSPRRSVSTAAGAAA
jgi:hypothetical protein